MDLYDVAVARKLSSGVGGGGGSSDFSTAEVTIVGGQGLGSEVVLPIITEMAFGDYTGIVSTELFESGIQTVVLYQGHAYADGVYISSVSGNATLTDEGKLKLLDITGDCTITIS